MKRDFDRLIVDLDGQPVRLGQSMETLQSVVNAMWPKLSPELQKEFSDAMDKHMNVPLTLGSACVGALMGAYDDERNLGDDERMSRMELARRIHKGGIQDIEPKDRDRVKPLLRKRYMGILVPVVCAELLEVEAVLVPVVCAELLEVEAAPVPAGDTIKGVAAAESAG
jgi:hypothetical protein